MNFSFNSLQEMVSSFLLPILITLSFFHIQTPCFSQKYTETQMNSSNDFIKISCGVTRYPAICYTTLSAYAGFIQDDPAQLVNASLQVTLRGVESTSKRILILQAQAHKKLRPKEIGAIIDCVENLKNSIDELKDSMGAMRDLEGPQFEMEMSNMQTWVSAALTDEDTCMDGFEGNGLNGKVKETVRSYIVRVSQLTSNALALINHLG